MCIGSGSHYKQITNPITLLPSFLDNFFDESQPIVLQGLLKNFFSLVGRRELRKCCIHRTTFSDLSLVDSPYIMAIEFRGTPLNGLFITFVLDTFGLSYNLQGIIYYGHNHYANMTILNGKVFFTDNFAGKFNINLEESDKAHVFPDGFLLCRSNATISKDHTLCAIIFTK